MRKWTMPRESSWETNPNRQLRNDISRAKHPQRKRPSENPQANISKSKFRSEKSKANVSKRSIPNDCFLTKITTRRSRIEGSQTEFHTREMPEKHSSRTEIIKRKVASERPQANDPKPKLPTDTLKQWNNLVRNSSGHVGIFVWWFFMWQRIKDCWTPAKPDHAFSRCAWSSWTRSKHEWGDPLLQFPR